MRKLLLFSFLVAGMAIYGQDWLSPQAGHKISGKAAKGGLYDLTIDEDAGEFRLTFLTKNKKKKAEFEQYVYDLKTLEEKGNEEFEVERGQSGRGFIFASRREVEYTNSPYFLTVRSNLVGTMVVERGYYTAATESLSTINIGGKKDEDDKGLFNRKNLGVINQYVLYEEKDKEKFKDDDDRRFTLIASRNMASDAQLRQSAIDETLAFDGMGDILLVAMPTHKIFKEDKMIPNTRFHFMKVSAENLSMTTDNPYKFEKMHAAVSSITHANGDLSIIFKPIPKNPGQGSISDDYIKENQQEYTMVRINSNAEIVAESNFEMPWGDINIISSESEDGGIILAGFSNPDKSTAANMGDASTAFIDRKDVVITKLDANGNQAFLTIIKGPDLIKNTVATTNEKIKLPKPDKADKYFNRKSTIGGITEAKGKYFFHFYSGKEDLNHLVAFSEDGSFAKGFAAELVNVLDYFEVVGLNNENAVYWSIVQHDTKKVNKQTVAERSTLRIGKINLDDLSIGEMVPVGDGDYFVNNFYVNAVPSQDNILLFLDDGKKLHFSMLKM